MGVQVRLSLRGRGSAQGNRQLQSPMRNCEPQTQVQAPGRGAAMAPQSREEGRLPGWQEGGGEAPRSGLLLSMGALWSSAGLQDRRTWLCFSR